MKNQSSHEDDNTAAILATAKFAYRTLADALQDAITRLKEDRENAEGAKIREAVVRSHAKQLQTIIELEVDLAKRSETVCPTHVGNKLDLDTAREEISRRLAKLAEQRGG